MKIIAFGTLKGGVGKTLTSFNVGGILAEQGKKILLIDADLQSNLTSNLGIDNTQPNFKSIRDIFEGTATIDDVICKSPIEDLPCLDAIPSSIFLHRTERFLSTMPGRERVLNNFFEDNKKIINKYDYIVFDTNPSMSIINENVFYVSDHIILNADVSKNSLIGAELFMALWGDTAKALRKKNNISGLLINNADKRIKLATELIEYCKSNELFKDILFQTTILQNVKIKESEIYQQPINLFAKNTSACEGYMKLITEMIERGIL